ncbi:MAG: hypothetical protein ACOX37_00215 [Bacillota bacterium]
MVGMNKEAIAQKISEEKIIDIPQEELNWGSVSLSEVLIMIQGWRLVSTILKVVTRGKFLKNVSGSYLGSAVIMAWLQLTIDRALKEFG